MEGRVKVNVGGRQFETTTRTLHSSLLLPNPPPFVDRDPSLFSLFLSLLRSPLASDSISLQKQEQHQSLIDEASYYGLESRLRSALAPPPFLGYDASLAATLVPASDAFTTAISAGPDGSVLLGHAGVISSYDWSLAYTGTLRTHLNRITSLARLGLDSLQSEVAIVGSLDSPGLHLYNLAKGTHLGTVQWSEPSDPRLHKSWVTAIAPPAASLPSHLFVAFEAPHRENCILCVDPATLQVTGEIGRQSGSAAKSGAAGRVVHLPELGGLVFMSSVSSGAFGYSGYMRLWDPRSGDAVWETSEPGGRSRNSSRFGDSFADVDVDREQLALYKVCWKSGDIGVADLRRLGDDPWIYLSDSDAAVGGGISSILHCYKRQVFVGRQSGLEVWSRLDETTPGTCKRNWMDREEDTNRGAVRRMEGGGDRLFLCRQGIEGVEVWETSRSSRAVSLDP